MLRGVHQVKNIGLNVTNVHMILKLLQVILPLVLGARTVVVTNFVMQPVVIFVLKSHLLHIQKRYTGILV